MQLNSPQTIHADRDISTCTKFIYSLIYKCTWLRLFVMHIMLKTTQTENTDANTFGAISIQSATVQELVETPDVKPQCPPNFLQIFLTCLLQLLSVLFFLDTMHKLNCSFFRAVTYIFNRALTCDRVKHLIEFACCILASMSALLCAVPLVSIFIVYWKYVFDCVKCTIESVYLMLASISAVRILCILVKTVVEILSTVFIQTIPCTVNACLVLELLRFLRGVAGSFLLEVVYFLVYGRRLER